MGQEEQDSGSFADLVHAANSDHPRRDRVVEAWLRPIIDGRWTDASGAGWVIRGRRMEPAGPALRRLLRRPDLRVLHAYGPHPREVSGLEREALLHRVEQYATGDAPPHSAFLLAEFRNDSRQVMLVIEEMC